MHQRSIGDRHKKHICKVSLFMLVTNSIIALHGPILIMQLHIIILQIGILQINIVLNCSLLVSTSILLVTHHGVNVEWRSWGVVVGAEPGEWPPLWGSTGCDSPRGAAFPSPPLASFLRANAVRGMWWQCMCGCVSVLWARGLVVMVSMVTVVSLLGWVASVMVEAWSSGCAASTAWRRGRRGWRGGGGEEDSPPQFTVVGLGVGFAPLAVLSVFWKNSRGSVCILENPSSAEWRALDGTSSAYWSCQRSAAVWRRWWRSTIMILKVGTSIHQPWTGWISWGKTSYQVQNKTDLIHLISHILFINVRWECGEENYNVSF